MNDSVTIAVASPGDTREVQEIGRLTFYETWRKVNTEEDMQLYMREAFDEEKIKSDITNTKLNLFLLARQKEETIGYAKLRRDRTYEEFKGEKAIEIERIYVKNEYQEKKIGKRLMDHCIEIARSENCRWLWLAVNDENEKALYFYRKYGFEVFGSKMFKLGNTEDRDFLMKLKIS